MEAKKEEDNSKALKIKEQIEYYLSDENLKKDTFFHQRISSDPKGFVELTCFLKCNKIKQAGWTKDELVEGIKLSDQVELDEKEERVRRKDNKPLPELNLLGKKKKKDEEGGEKEKKEEKSEEDEKDPVILRIKCEKSTEISWKDINEKFKEENPSLNITYGRFKENEGHFAVILKKNEELKFTEKFKVADIEFSVQICEGEDLVNFWKDHGSHYEFCLKDKRRRNKNDKNKKGQKNNKKNPRNSTALENPVTLGGQRFTDIVLIKAEVRKIMNNTKDDQPLAEKDKNLIMDLLKYHHSYDDKVKDLDYITVGKSEKFKYTRCFLIVKKNKEKVDFSFQKCIDNLYEKANE